MWIQTHRLIWAMTSVSIGVIRLTDVVEKGLKRIGVTISKPVLAVIASIFGFLVIALPDLLQWIVGLFFIIEGILLLVDYFELRRR